MSRESYAGESCPYRACGTSMIIWYDVGAGVAGECSRCGASWFVCDKQLISRRRWKSWGYEVRTEWWCLGSCVPMVMEGMAYTLDGDLIGSSREAVYLCRKLGVAPEKADPGDVVCSIGKSRTDGKWYGWSHRALCGFGRGDRIFEESFGTDKTPFTKHGRRFIRNDADAKLAARRFARSVS